MNGSASHDASATRDDRPASALSSIVESADNDQENHDDGDVQSAVAGESRDGDNNDHHPHSEGAGSPVPTFFSGDQVAALITAIFSGIPFIPQTASNVSISSFLEAFPIFTEGDCAELQQNAFAAVQHFHGEFSVTRRSAANSYYALPASEHILSNESGAVEVPSTQSRAQSASGAKSLASSQSLPPPPRALGSAPLHRRNPVVASQVAAASKPSLYRPQTAGSGSNSSTVEGAPASMHLVTLDASEVAAHAAAATGNSGGGSTGALPQPLSRPATSSVRPQSSNAHHNKTGAELAVKTFFEVERQLKDERGQNRFAFTEYQLEERVEDHAVVDRRQKSIQTNVKDLDLLHSLDPVRRQYMMQLFNDPEMMAKRKKRLEAEELLKEVRHAQAASINVSSGRKCSPPRSQLDATKGNNTTTTTSPSGQLSPQRRPSSVQPTPTSKRWGSASNEMEVWNAVRTRPPSAAAALPFDTPASTATSVVARLIPRPQSTDGVATVTRDTRPTYNMSFAEMVAQRRDSLQFEGAKLPSPTPRENSAASTTRKQQTSLPPPLSPPTPSLGGDAQPPLPHKKHQQPGGSGRSSSTATVNVIGVGDLGFHPKAETLVRTVEVGVGGGGNEASQLPFTTIATAAYIPMAQKAPPSASLSQREQQQIGGKLSRSRAKIDAIKQNGKDTAQEDTVHTVSTGTTHRQNASSKSATKSAVSTAASAVATAAAIRVQRADSAPSPNKKTATPSVEPWPL
ncbi:Hypothetical protein, putative [Bodo saltans]|uniref:Uncharacterized protein n=1 Tax=Bodo saltans TaxID=75058 RepID=A0A0S4KJV6_BODSA|nr:Hypothetical protein, putative [Bodo saltans]|eukprot:CUI15276.1 Hypothetical protein, putative [Bodo saltans]